MKSLLSAVLVAAGASSAADADVPVTITFVAEIAGESFSCSETYAGLGTPGADVQVLDFRFYVSEAALIAANGSLRPITLIPGRGMAGRAGRANRLRGRRGLLHQRNAPDKRHPARHRARRRLRRPRL